MKKITNILLAALVLTSFAITPAKADDTYERICAPQGWTSCGEFIIYDADGIQVNRVVGPIPCNNCFPAGGSAVLITTTKPEPIIRTEIVAGTTLTSTINVETKVVAPNSDGSIGYNPNSGLISIIDSNTSATISASETRTVTTLNDFNVETTESILYTETESFTSPKTRSQIEASIENRLRLIQQYLNRFYILLNGWLVE
jgi:hypothetical protein